MFLVPGSRREPGTRNSELGTRFLSDSSGVRLRFLRGSAGTRAPPRTSRLEHDPLVVWQRRCTARFVHERHWRIAHRVGSKSRERTIGAGTISSGGSQLHQRSATDHADRSSRPRPRYGIRQRRAACILCPRERGGSRLDDHDLGTPSVGRTEVSATWSNSHSSRSATGIGSRAARMAGNNPPINPISSA